MPSKGLNHVACLLVIILENVFHLLLLKRCYQGRRFTIRDCVLKKKILLPPMHTYEQCAISDTDLYFSVRNDHSFSYLFSLTTKHQTGSHRITHIRVVLFPISHFPFCFLFPFPFFASTWQYRLFPSFFNIFSIDLAPVFCSFTLIFPRFTLSISGLRLCTALWDQIRFTSGLNVCSHGLLHLKGNSFSWNIGVQFETRLMLANFTPLFLQNVSSIAHINC